MKRAFSPRLMVGLGVILAVVLSAACGGRPADGASSNMMQKTFAGQNKCNPKNQERPFIIDWDATDQSSFQARAATDVIVVHYENCELKVLDSCANDSVKGALGAYRPVDWTAGQLESIEMRDEGELYVKLPLGAASLSGRVQRGEKFHMEYYVSGTRSSTRSAVYRADLGRIPGCQGATHFVYAFNLGAFALASTSSLQGQAQGSYFGFGSGGASSSSTKADKRGGDLARCQGNSATEVDQCKVPIRLALREISEGANPDVAASRAEETDPSLNLAGKLQASTDREKEAGERANAAREKQIAGDGPGCLAELDRHDQLDPTPSRLSTNPKSGELARVRVRCLMLSGQCDRGRDLGRKVLDAQSATDIDGQLDLSRVGGISIGEFCRGTSASPRDQFLRAYWVLQMASAGDARADAAECQRAYETTRRLEGEAGTPFRSPDSLKSDEIRCVARTDCDLAWRLFNEPDAYLPDVPPLIRELNGAIRAHDKSAIEAARRRIRAVPAQARAANRGGAAGFRSAVTTTKCEPPSGALGPESTSVYRTSGPKPAYAAMTRPGPQSKQYGACFGDCFTEFNKKNNCEHLLPRDMKTGMVNIQHQTCTKRRLTCDNDCRSAYCVTPGDTACPQGAARE